MIGLVQTLPNGVPFGPVPDFDRLAFGGCLFPLCLVKGAALESMRGIYDLVPSLAQSRYDR